MCQCIRTVFKNDSDMYEFSISWLYLGVQKKFSCNQVVWKRTISQPIYVMAKKYNLKVNLEKFYAVTDWYYFLSRYFKINDSW